MAMGFIEFVEMAAEASPEMQQAQEPQPRNPVILEQEREQDSKARALEVYKRWQKNTIATAELQRQLLQGAKTGCRYAELLLIAAQALALTTGNDLIYTQIAQEIERRGDYKPDRELHS